MEYDRELGWPFVNRTQEAVEKGVAYILTGQHLGRRPEQAAERPRDRGKPS